MKKQILSIIFILSLSFSSSQLISYEAIWVNDGMEEDYISVEELWSEVKKQAIADDIQDFWVVFKVEKDSTNPESMKKPDYIVFNGFKDDEQRKKQTNWKELAMKVYKGKMSKRKFEKAWEKTPTVRKETRNFLVERLDNTMWSAPEEGQSLDFRFNGFQALNDDYENYEMKFFKDWHEKRTNAGVQAWWEFNKVINRSKNANQEVTHFTLDILKDGASEYEHPDSSLFTHQMLVKNGVASRKRIIGDKMTMLYSFSTELIKTKLNMKKYILSTLFVLSISISFSQLITHTSVRVDDSERESYLELEEFWSKIHEQAIKDEYSDGWMLWEFTYKDDEEAKGKPDFLIMNFHKDSLQRQKGNSIDVKEYARKSIPIYLREILKKMEFASR